MIERISIAVLIVALVLVLWRWSVCGLTRDEEVARRLTAEHDANVARADGDQAEARADTEQRRRVAAEDLVQKLEQEVARLQSAHAPKPAKFVLEGQMSSEDIAEALNGSASLPLVKAVLSHLAAKMVTLSDRATDPSRPDRRVNDQVIPGYSNDDRLHDAGGATALAEAIGELQEITKAKETAEAAS